MRPRLHPRVPGANSCQRQSPILANHSPLFSGDSRSPPSSLLGSSGIAGSHVSRVPRNSRNLAPTALRLSPKRGSLCLAVDRPRLPATQESEHETVRRRRDRSARSTHRQPTHPPLRRGCRGTLPQPPQTIPRPPGRLAPAGHSMGRLTLNILLSFAQFEREIIGERIRDKISAQRRRGKWTGGVPILGYDVDRSSASPKLVINAAEAVQVRRIFGLYLELGSLLPVAAELAKLRIHNKAWSTKAGQARGGRPFDKCTLHSVLTNPVDATKQIGARNKLNCSAARLHQTNKTKQSYQISRPYRTFHASVVVVISEVHTRRYRRRRDRRGLCWHSVHRCPCRRRSGPGGTLRAD